MTGFDETVPPDDDPDRDENATTTAPAERPTSLEDEAERAAAGTDEWPGPEDDAPRGQ